MMMKLLMTCTAVLLMVAANGIAQTDNFGTVDTVYADVNQIDDYHWSITVSYTNDENILGMSVPLKLSAGTVKIVADSAVYTGGRIEHFDYKGFRPDTTIQCVTLGMIANMGPSKKILAPGNGRLVTVYVSSVEGKAFDKLTVDTTTTSPNNSLMCVADQAELKRMLGEEEPTQLDRRIEVFPAFVVRYNKE